MTDLASSLVVLPHIIMPRIQLGEWIDGVVEWLTTHWSGLFDGIADGLNSLVLSLDEFLMSLPIVFVVAVLALLAFATRGWKMALAAVAGLLFIDSLDMWPSSMETFAVVIVAAAIAILLAVPIGILAAKSRVASTIVRPTLDFMQTLPAFVYLLPVLFFFGLGYAAAILATIVFAIPPGVRLTELGIRQVDAEMTEAGHAFGATPRKILLGVELPLALPTIMAGVNQVIMLALSMVVIGGMVGGGGLGGDVTAALANLEVGPGTEAGVSVVIIAIYLDRVTAGVGQGHFSRTRSNIRKLLGRPAAAAAAAKASDVPTAPDTGLKAA